MTFCSSSSFCGSSLLQVTRQMSTKIKKSPGLSKISTTVALIQRSVSKNPDLILLKFPVLEKSFEVGLTLICGGFFTGTYVNQFNAIYNYNEFYPWSQHRPLMYKAGFINILSFALGYSDSIVRYQTYSFLVIQPDFFR